MSRYTFYSLDELQSMAQGGDTDAMTELGRRVMDYDFCNGTNGCRVLCCVQEELDRVMNDLNSEPPESCPHCDLPIKSY